MGWWKRAGLQLWTHSTPPTFYGSTSCCKGVLPSPRPSVYFSLSPPTWATFTASGWLSPLQTRSLHPIIVTGETLKLSSLHVPRLVNQLLPLNQSKFGPFYPSTQRPEGSSPCLSIKLHFWPLSGHSLHHAHGLLFRSSNLSIYLLTAGLWPCWDCPLGCPSPSLHEQPQRCWSSVLASLNESLVPRPSMCHPPCCAFCSSS